MACDPRVLPLERKVEYLGEKFEEFLDNFQTIIPFIKLDEEKLTQYDTIAEDVRNAWLKLGGY